MSYFIDDNFIDKIKVNKRAKTKVQSEKQLMCAPIIYVFNFIIDLIVNIFMLILSIILFPIRLVIFILNYLCGCCEGCLGVGSGGGFSPLGGWGWNRRSYLGGNRNSSIV